MLLAKVRVFSDEDNFGDHQSVDQGCAIIVIVNVELIQQEHAVGGKGAKEKGQIQKDSGELLKFVGGLLFGRGLAKCGRQGVHRASLLAGNPVA